MLRQKLLTHSTQQSIMTSIMCDVSSCYCVRSARSNLLVVPPVDLSTSGRSAFRVTGPNIWNSLSEHLRDPYYHLMCSSITSKHTFAHY